MSAFFVQDGTIDDVVAVFIEHVGQIDHPDVLGAILLQMNAEALRQRYPQIDDKERAEYALAAKTYTFNPPSTDPLQRMKSCHCLRYQCHEGDVPETSKLYEILDMATKKMDEIHGESDVGEWDRVRGAILTMDKRRA